MIGPLAPVRQRVSDDAVKDVTAEVCRGLRALPLRARVRPGMRIALAIGSRGISCVLEIVRTVIQELQALGAHPFLIPAMGSHGGGTAEGQREVLLGYGLVPEVLGVPIVSSMDTICIGETSEGAPVYFDANAARADGIIAINRIKEHTSFRGQWESGLLKILAVGLGKERGAREIHAQGMPAGMIAAGRVVLSRMPVLAGIGVVENGHCQPARISVLASEQIEEEEPLLLDLSRRLAPRLPFDPLDLLVIEEMGKDISGTGMDLNVIGMWRRLGGPRIPDFRVIALLELTDKSLGNATGVGFADLITQRLLDRIDLEATRRNCLTARNLQAAKIPIALPSDRDVILAGLVGTNRRQARMVLIRNTLALDLLWISESLLACLPDYPQLEQLGPPQELVFDPAGNLVSPFGFRP